MNLKKSAISQACSWHSPFKGCMFGGWDYSIFLFKSLIANSHCPLLDDFREEKNVPLSLCFPRLWIINRNHEQSKSKSRFLFPLPGPRYWSIPTRQIIVTSAKVIPSAGLREPCPPNLKKKISFRNHRIIMDNCFPVYIAFQNQVFPCFVTSTMTRPKRCYFSKALGDFDLWWQLQSEPSIRLRPRLRGR